MVTLGGLDMTLLLGLMAVHHALASKCDICNVSWHENWYIMTSRCRVNLSKTSKQPLCQGSWIGL